MATLTKDQLKNALITHSVELPSASAKKEEYLRLYEEFVAPTEKAKSDFSSDEEDVVPVEEKKANMDQNFIVDGFDITSLSDDELFKRLSELGATVGPIVASTRKVYQMKLLVLMGGYAVDSPPAYNGDVDEEDEYSDNDEVEEVVEVEEPVKTCSASRLDSSIASPSPSKNIDLRKRVFAPSDEQPRSKLVFDPDRHTPSPRPSLRSVTSTTTSMESTRVRKYVNNGGSGIVNATGSDTTEEEEEQDKQSKISLIVRLIVKLLFLALIIALIYYVYQNDPGESPFKAVEQLARQALEAAVGEEAEAPGVDSAEDAPVDSPPSPEPEAVPAL